VSDRSALSTCQALLCTYNVRRCYFFLIILSERRKSLILLKCTLRRHSTCGLTQNAQYSAANIIMIITVVFCFLTPFKTRKQTPTIQTYSSIFCSPHRKNLKSVILFAGFPTRGQVSTVNYGYHIHRCQCISYIFN
jgi:hypothetical protein